MTDANPIIFAGGRAGRKGRRILVIQYVVLPQFVPPTGNVSVVVHFSDLNFIKSKRIFIFENPLMLALSSLRDAVLNFRPAALHPSRHTEPGRET